MKALLVHVNGKRLCLAGIGDDGVMGMTVTWTGSKGAADRASEERIYFHVGGLDSAASERVDWETPPLKVGDSVMITIVESDSVDPATSRHHFTPRHSDED